MMLPIARCVQPHDLAHRMCRRECVQHRQNGCCTDPSAEQHDRLLSRLQNKTSARGADVEVVAHTKTCAQVLSSRSVRLDLHADSITLC